MKGGVVMDKKLLGAVALVTLVVAVIASVVTASITGNFIRVNDNPSGKYRVYNVKEINDMNSTIDSRLKVLEAESGGSGFKVLVVKSIRNSSVGFTQDYVEFSDLETGNFYKPVITSEGRGVFDLLGKSYQVSYWDNPNVESDESVTVVSSTGVSQSAKKNGFMYFWG